MLTLNACQSRSTAASSNRTAPVSGTAALISQIRTQLVEIPAGRYQMGSSLGDADDELPVHWVEVPGFRLSRHEITASQFAVFERSTGRASGGGLVSNHDHPALNISWDDAIAFIEWLNQIGSVRYRLPTEAEWEYAARAGTTSRYWWGDEYQADFLNGTGVSGDDRWLETAPVGSFPANGFGLHDMLGNVWEWTLDCYEPTYAGAPADGSATEDQPACGRVLRGGSWSDTPIWLRTATRNWFDRGERFDYVGFRLAAD